MKNFCYRIIRGLQKLRNRNTKGINKERTDTVRVLQPGESRTWQLKLAAGETVCEDFDLPAEGNDHPAGIKLYDKTIYTDGSCVFDRQTRKKLF